MVARDRNVLRTFSNYGGENTKMNCHVNSISSLLIIEE